jgi:hypothetical protein
MNSLFLLVTVFLALLWANSCLAIDTIKLLQPPPDIDTRVAYKNELIKLVLEQTKDGFGEYNIEFVASPMVRGRAMQELIRGELINVFISPADVTLEQNTASIRIPIRKGILGYRLLLIHKQDEARFKAINTADELKLLVAGLQSEWSTTKIMTENGYKVLRVHNYESLFKMLNARRFDYVPRGVHEIYDEIKSRNKAMDNLMVEPHIALLMPLPTYTYVSPKEPRLAKRIETGLKQIIANGELNKLFDRYYADDIARANLSGRKLIEIKTPFTDREVPYLLINP